MSLNTKYKNLAGNSILFLIGSIGSKLITFFLVPLYTNVLSPGEYGVTDIVTTSVILCIPIFSLSLDDAIMRFGLMKGVSSERIAINMATILAGSTVAVVLAYPIFAQIGLFEEWTPYFCAILILHIIRNAFSIFLKSLGRVKIFTIDSIIYAAILGISNFLLLKVFSLNIKGYFLALIIAMTSSLLLQATIGGIAKDIIRSQGIIDKKLLKSMIKYSSPLIFSAISWWVINSSDRYMLRFMMGVDEVGLYGISAKIPNFLGVFTQVFSSAWLISSISEYENERDRKFYSNVFSYYLAFLAIGTSIIMMFLKWFMKIYVSPAFYISWKYVPLLLVAAVCGTLVSFFSPIFKAELKNIHEMMVVIIGATTNVIVNFLCIPYLGIQGASIGTIISEALMLLICVVGTRKYFSFDINFFVFLGTMGLLVLQAISLICVDEVSAVVSLGSLGLVVFLNRGIISAIFIRAKQMIVRRTNG